MMWRRRFIAVCSLLLSIGAPAFAQAVDPSRVTPKSFSPAPVRTSTGIILGEVAPGAVPDGADRLSITIASASVAGEAPPACADTGGPLSKIVGKRVTVRALYGAAAEIEAACGRAGYVLTRVTIPPQRLADGGVFKLMIVDGFIEAVDVSAVPESQREAVRARVATLVGVHGLTMADIERRLLIAGDLPGLHLTSALVKGEQVGGAKLVLQADWRPVSVSIGVDNKLGSSYRGVEFPVTASLNSVFGLGESIYGAAITGPDVDTLFSGNPIRRVGALGVIMPIGLDGWTINPEYTRSVTNPVTAPGAVRINGVFDHWALRSLYPLIKTRQASLTLSGAFEAVNETQTASDFGVATSIDRLRIFTAGLEASRGLDWGANLAGGLLITQGTNLLDARTRADAAASGIPLSRDGSRPDYTKIEGHLRYDQRLPADFTAATIVRAQQAISGPMPGAGQFALDGDDALSAFDAGALSVDSGFSARTELARPFAIEGMPLASIAAPYLFGAVGVGTVDSPTSVEKGRVTAGSYGLGLRFNIAEPRAGLASLATIEVGRAHANIVNGNNTRITASWTLRY